MAAPQNYVSVSRRPPDVEDYIDILRRYRSWIIGPTFAGLVISVVASFFMPDVYVCTASMQIRPSAVSNSLLPSAINDQMSQRLQELRLEILGRDNLITLIQMPKLNLYPKERQRYSVEDVAEEFFAKKVHIVPYESIGSNGAQAFRIVFEYPDKNVARMVVSELVTEFDNKNSSVQAENAKSTSTLFDDLVKSATDKLEQKQKALADFESANPGRLQQDLQANWLESATLRTQIDNLNTAISQEEQRRASFENQLNTNKAQQTDAENNLHTTQTTSSQTVTNSNLINVTSDINHKQEECAALERRYLPNYPDVLACHDQLKVLEQRQEQMGKTQSAQAGPGSTTKIVINAEAEHALKQLQSQEQDLKQQIANSELQEKTLKNNLDGKNKELAEVEAKISASPQVIQKYNQLAQDVKRAEDEYANLSTKREAAGTQETVEEHSAGERLEILENPITPEKPTSPVRGAWVGIGTMVGLVLGVVLAGAKEVKDTSLKNLKDVRAYTNLPVLSSIPLLENALLVRRKRRLAWLAWSSALIIGTVLMSGAMYYHYVIVPQS